MGENQTVAIGKWLSPSPDLEWLGVSDPFRIKTLDDLSLRSLWIIVVVIKRILKSVRRAMVMAEVGGLPRYDLPFPSNHHEKEYVDGLRNAIRQLRRAGKCNLLRCAEKCCIRGFRIYW
jgi:hypothetical protein